MSIESIKARLRRHDRQRMRYGYSDETAPQIWERELRALLKVAEAAKVIDDAMPAAYGIMKMWVVVEYMEDLRAALTELEAQE